MNNMSERTRHALKAGFIGIVTNLILFIIKVTAGAISGSVSIMADAINNLGDFASSLIVIIGFFISQKPADKEHPFGHARIEYLSGFVVSILIISVGVQFLFESINGIFNPRDLNITFLTIIVMIVSILIKLSQSIVYYKSSKKIKSNAIEASFIDSLSDSLITFCILLGLILGQIFHINLDGFLGVFVAGLVIYSGIVAIMKSIDDLIGIRPNDEIKKAVKLLDSYDSIIGYHDLLIHNYGGENNFATVHIELWSNISLDESHKIADKIEYDFMKKLKINMVVHVDPVRKKTSFDNIIIENIKQTLSDISGDFKIHDIQIDKDGQRQKIVFDLVVPENVKTSDLEIKNRIKNNLKSVAKDLVVDIIFDRNYMLDEN